MAEIAGLILLALIVVFVLFRRKDFVPPTTTASDAKIHQSYRAAESLFVNRSELAFFHALVRVLPDGYFLQSKVRLEDIVGVKPAIKDAKLRWSLRGRVKSRHVDYLVIDVTGRPCLAVELDGAVHRTRETDNADTLKDGIFKACGIPLMRVRTGDNFHTCAGEIADRLQR